MRNATAANLTCVAPQDEAPASGMDVPVSTVVFAVAAALSGTQNGSGSEDESYTRLNRLHPLSELYTTQKSQSLSSV